jgi:hypothetical protein
MVYLATSLNIGAKVRQCIVVTCESRSASLSILPNVEYRDDWNGLIVIQDRLGSMAPTPFVHYLLDAPVF